VNLPVCPTVPDDVAAALAPLVPASVAAIADRVARGGPHARCAWQEGPAGRDAVLTSKGIAVVRRWPDGPAEVLLVRPVPYDAEGRIAASAAWQGEVLALTWWDDIAAPCAEEIDASLAIHWTCPDRPAPPVEQPIPWPDPRDR
jgi:hypothetical protein